MPKRGSNTKKNSKTNSRKRFTKRSRVNTLFNSVSQIKPIPYGCKIFSSKMYVNYLHEKGIIPTTNFDIYSREIMDVILNLNRKIVDGTVMIHDIRLNASFLSQLDYENFKRITKDKLVYCILFKRLEGGIILSIHAFILNGNVIYNSWSSDTSCPRNQRHSFASEHISKNEGSYYRESFKMKPTEVYVPKVFTKLNHLVSSTSTFEDISELFGINSQHVIGLGNKKNKNPIFHREITQRDMGQLLENIHGSDILFLYE